MSVAEHGIDTAKGGAAIGASISEKRFIETGIDVILYQFRSFVTAASIFAVEKQRE